MSVGTEQAPVESSKRLRSENLAGARSRWLHAAMFLTLGVSLSFALTHAVPIFFDGLSSAVKHLTVSLY